MGIWDGVAVIVGAPQSLWHIAVPLSASFLGIAAAALWLVYISSRWLRGTCALSVASIVMSIGVHSISSTGFVQSHDAVREIQACVFERVIPTIDYATLQEMGEYGKCTIVDARPAGAFAKCHIPGAINIPIESGYLDLKHAATAIDDGKPVVVYCQSETCPWSDEIARQLLARRAIECYVYRGGANEWRAMQE